MISIISQMFTHPASWLMASVIAVSLPVLQRQPASIIVAIVLVSIWQLFSIYRPTLKPSKFTVFLITMVLIALVFITYGSVTGKTAGSALLCSMVFCKALESSSHRDSMLILFLCFFIISINFLFSQSIATAVYMLLCLLLLIVTMITVNQANATILNREKFKHAINITLYAFPVMLVCFLLFPRIEGPLWAMKNDKTAATTGITDTMEPGKFNEIIKSNTLAFRVKFHGAPVRQDKLYWRALVLWNFDGQRWTKSDEVTPAPLFIESSSNPISYTITVEPTGNKWLYALDIPFSVNSNNAIDANYTIKHQENIDHLYRYSVVSHTKYKIDRRLSDIAYFAGLQLPANTNPLARKLANNWKQSSNNDREIVSKAIRFMKTSQFYYTLEPPVLSSSDRIDEFLFKTRKGFCEHFASSFAFLMRSASIPARIVIGFQGGYYNPVNDVMSIDNSMAHAWTEVWLEDEGWVRIDPTALVAPARIEQGLEEALSPGESLPIQFTLNSGWLRDIRNYLDAIDNGWDQWIIGYGPKLQKAFLQHITGHDFTLNEISRLFIYGLIVILSIIALAYLVKLDRNQLTEYEKLYRQFLKLVHRKTGMVKMPYEGELNFSSKVLTQYPQLKQPVEQLTEAFITIKYRSQESSELYQSIIESLKKLSSITSRNSRQ